MGYIPLSIGGAYPGLYLFTSPSRFVRPVRNISIPSEESHNIELIGPFEQVIPGFPHISFVFYNHILIFTVLANWLLDVADGCQILAAD